MVGLAEQPLGQLEPAGTARERTLTARKRTLTARKLTLTAREPTSTARELTLTARELTLTAREQIARLVRRVAERNYGEKTTLFFDASLMVLLVGARYFLRFGCFNALMPDTTNCAFSNAPAGVE